MGSKEGRADEGLRVSYGGSLCARFWEYLTQERGQPVVVVNKPGAGGSMAKAILQNQYVGPGSIDYVNAADDPRKK